jgi:hypothetical protein
MSYVGATFSQVIGMINKVLVCCRREDDAAFHRAVEGRPIFWMLLGSIVTSAGRP